MVLTILLQWDYLEMSYYNKECSQYPSSLGNIIFSFQTEKIRLFFIVLLCPVSSHNGTERPRLKEGSSISFMSLSSAW